MFRALRAVKHTTQSVTNRMLKKESLTRDAILEVVAAVLNHGDPAVFAQAAVPCVQCLMKLLLDEPTLSHAARSLSELSDVSNTSDGSEGDSKGRNSQQSLSLVMEDLNRFAKALSTIFSMRNRPHFRGAERIRLPGDGLIVRDMMLTLDSDSSGILIVWALLLNGLAEVVPQCGGSLQNEVAGLMFGLLRAAVDVPGLSFFAHMLTSVLLPVLNNWAVRDGWDHESASSFSHVGGKTMDLIAEQLPRLGESTDSIVVAIVPDLIKKTVELVTALISQEEEKIARLGCSTYR